MGNRSGREHHPAISGQFAPRLIEMLESPAYRQLSLSARRVLDRLEIELARHGGNDNGRLPVTYEDFEQYGVDRHAIRPAISELVALGFVKITQHGAAGNADFRRPNLFLLTSRDAKGHHRGDGTHDWRAIKSIEEAAALARAARAPVREKIKTGGGFTHRKPDFQTGETRTTGHSGETPTTLDISEPSVSHE